MQASEALLLVVASLVFGLDTNLVHAEDSGVSGMRTSGDEMTKALAQDAAIAVSQRALLSPGCHLTMAGGFAYSAAFRATVPEKCSSDTSKAAVRCCDDAGKGYSNVPTCNKEKTYAQAKTICEGNGKRLCQKSELNKASGTGCGFDTVRIWTSTSPSTASPTAALTAKSQSANKQSAQKPKKTATDNQPEQKSAATDNQPLPTITECCALKKEKKDCMPHPGLTFQSKWYEPYQKQVLPKEYRNIPHKVCNGGECKEELVDCNPASCDNPPVCGLPECWAAGPSFGKQFVSIKVTDLAVPANKRNDETDAGKAFTKARLTHSGQSGHKLWYKISSFADDQFPNEKNGFRGADLQLPALRQGSADEVWNGPGFINCSPVPGARFADCTATWGQMCKGKLKYGWPHLKSCNPHGLLSCTKVAWAHTGVKNGKFSNFEAVLLYKSSWCINGVCPCDKKGKCSTDCPARCYTKKAGRCFKFTGKYRGGSNRGDRGSVTAPMPAYPQNQNSLHAMYATKEAKAGRYTYECSEEGLVGTKNVIGAA